VPFKTVIVKGLGKIKFPSSMTDEAIEQSIKNLDMSESARMARAKEQGFDERIVYHGTQKDFDEFSGSRPHFFSKDPALANQFSKMRGDGLGGNVIQARVNTGSMFDYTNDDHISKIENYLREKGQLYDTDIRGDAINRIDGVRNGEFSAIEDDKVLEAIKNTGFDAFSVSETAEPIRYAKADRSRSVFSDKDMAKDKYNEVMERWKKYGMGNESIKPRVRTDKDRFIIDYQGDTFHQVGDDLGLFGKNVAVFNPSNIRGKNAAFNPDLKDSPSLLASSAPLMLGAGAMLKGEDTRADTGAIESPKHPKIADLRAFIDEHDDILMDDMLGGLTSYLDKLSYDDKITMKDRILMALDLL